jgi:hypothetical protein
MISVRPMSAKWQRPCVEAPATNDCNRCLAVSDLQAHLAANSWRPGSHSLGNCDDIMLEANRVALMAECGHRGASAALFTYSCLE